ncbi:hypothetical protein [Herbidospora sp. NBRC 101105]|uniref:hypothetical protein n=1 Tax=Herbidospora sp. NBRC 101105 TaxID=3032195 RepID=UPI0025528CE8|nr:hypothetical protein [Herbidospora sp. NBRC 101105]
MFTPALFDFGLLIVLIKRVKETTGSFDISRGDQVADRRRHAFEPDIPDDDQVRAPEIPATARLTRARILVHEPSDYIQGHESRVSRGAVGEGYRRISLLGGLRFMPFPSRDQHFETGLAHTVAGTVDLDYAVHSVLPSKYCKPLIEPGVIMEKKRPEP